MGETLAETRLEVARKRAELERDAAQLRDALDLRKRFRENPAAFVGLAAVTVFLVAGGPVRVAHLLRRRMMRTSPEKAYDALPKPMQAWVDTMAGAVGPRAADAREALSHELLRWRHDPRKHGKVNKKLAKELAEGPPGPRRAGWRAFEAGAAIVTAALARKAVERFLSGEPPIGHPALDAVGTAGGAAKPDARHAKDDVTRPPRQRAAAEATDRAAGNGSGEPRAESRGEYSSLSARSRTGEPGG